MQYIAIDLKSFYASVECIERGLDPLDTNLVVADASRTNKTICLAVSPSLKGVGVPGRPRLFEVEQIVKKANIARSRRAGGAFDGQSHFASELETDAKKELSYIVAQPRMAHYVKYSTDIYSVYLKYVSEEDIHVYSIDEVFMDVTPYLGAYHMDAHELARVIIKDVLATTGITATAGIGTNLYLAKIAMDIMAKHTKADSDGVRIASLDEMSYRQNLWAHRSLTDFWRVGKGYRKKLEAHGLYTMGDIARCSLGRESDYYNEDLLYKLFGVNAELLIDHAWGWEPCTMKHIKSYRPASHSISQGQVLHCPYICEKARLIVKEMTDALVLDLVAKGMVTNQIVLTVVYDIENLSDETRAANYHGNIHIDYYGRLAPEPAHGSISLETYTSSSQLIIKKTLELFDKIVDSSLLIRRIYIAAAHIKDKIYASDGGYEQISIFDIRDEKHRIEDDRKNDKERSIQRAVLDIKKKYGKNAILKGMNLEEGATAIDRNNQIGGHKA